MDNASSFLVWTLMWGPDGLMLWMLMFAFPDPATRGDKYYTICTHIFMMQRLDQMRSVASALSDPEYELWSICCGCSSVFDQGVQPHAALCVSSPVLPVVCSG